MRRACRYRPSSRKRCASSGSRRRQPLTGAPLTGGVSSDIWRIDTDGGPASAPSARWRSCGSRPTGARRSSATATKRAGCRSPTRRCPAARRPCWASIRRSACSRWSYLPPGQPPLWKAVAARGPGRPGDRARGRPRAGAHPRPLGGAAGARRGSSDTDAIFFDIRLEPYLLATARRHPDVAAALEAPRRARRSTTRSRWCTATSARRTSSSARTGRCCSMPNAPGGATRRSTSRSASTTCCSSACGRRRRRPRSWPASMRSATAYLDGCRLGAARRRSSAARRRCCRACCWPASTASRRSSTSTTEAAARAACGASRRALLQHAGRAPRSGCRRLARGDSRR